VLATATTMIRDALSKKKNNARQSKKPTRKARLFLEELEPRTLLAWSALGPSPQLDWVYPQSNFAEPVSGRVTSIAYSSDVGGVAAGGGGGAVPAVYIGTSGGGVWGTVQFNQPNPRWYQLSDNINGALDDRTRAATSAIGALAVDPGNPRVIYAGTGEANYSTDSHFGTGLLRSLDGGSSWDLIATGGSQTGVPVSFFGHAVSKILVDPTSPPMNVNVGGVAVQIRSRLYMSVVPAHHSDIGETPGYTTVDGIYQSTDGGSTWTKFFFGIDTTPLIVTDMDYTVANGGQFTIYAGVGNPAPTFTPGYNNGNQKGLYVGARNMQGNWVWNPVPQLPGNANGGPASANIGRIAIASDERLNAVNPVIYAAVTLPNSTLEGFYRANANTPNNWTRTTPPDPTSNGQYNQGNYDLALAINKANPNVVYLAGSGPFATTVNPNFMGIEQSTQSGNNGTWNAIDLIPGGPVPRPASNILPHPDHHALLAPDGSQLFDGNDGGIFAFTPLAGNQPGPNAWTDLNSVGLNTNLVLGVASDGNPNLASTVYVQGGQDNAASGARGTDGVLWHSLNAVSQRGGITNFGDTGLVRANTAGTVFYMAGNSSGGRLDLVGQATTTFVGLFTSQSQWLEIPNLGPLAADTNFPFYPALAISPVQHLVPVGLGQFGTRAWAAVGSTRVYQRQSTSWLGLVWPSYEWVTLSPELFRLQSGANPPISKVSAITYYNDDIMYVGLEDGRVYKFDDTRGGPAGADNINFWTRIDNTMAGAPPWGNTRVTAITNRPGDPNDIYVGLESFANASQIYRQASAGAAWTAVSGAGATALPALPVNAIRTFHDNLGDTILAASDAGVYYSLDHGARWFRYDLGLPYAPVTDLQWVGQTNRLIAGTFGRGVYHINFGQNQPPRPPRAAEGGLQRDIALGVVGNATLDESVPISIDWGDDSGLDTESGHFISTADGIQAAGDHLYKEDGDYTVTVTVYNGDGSVNQTLAATVEVYDADLHGISQTVAIAQSCQTPTEVTVGKFSDDNPFAEASDFDALITWADGTTSSGVVSANGDGTFSVSVNHLFANAGQFSVHIDVFDKGGSATQIDSTLDVLGNISAQLYPNYFIEGVDSSQITVAKFTDALSDENASDYSAVIQWGDGNSSTGLIQSNADGSYSVLANKTYGEEGSQYVTVDIDSVRGDCAEVAGETQVSDANLQAISLDVAPVHVANQFNVPVATFTDQNPSAGLEDFSAVINWGDGDGGEAGNAESYGAVSQLGNGTFGVAGSHTYDQPGTYDVTVTIGDTGGFSTEVSTQIVVYADSATTLISSANPSYLSQNVTFTANVLASDPGFDVQPTGSVDFVVDNQVVSTAELDGNGTATYTASALSVGNHSVYAQYQGSLYYTTSTSDPLTQVVYQLPVANNDTAQTVLQTPITIDVLANDTGDGPLTIVFVTQGTLGATSIVDNQIQYEPGSTVGIDTFVYTMVDVHGNPASATVTVTIGQPQLAAGGARDDGGLVPLLTSAELQPILAKAVLDVEHAFDVAPDNPLLSQIDIRLTTLQSGILGITFGHTIWLDQTAAGYGWFVDFSPQSDAIFGAAVNGQDRLAAPSSLAGARMDALTVVEHELHHLFGQGSVASTMLAHDLMTATLTPGVRRTAAETLLPAPFTVAPTGTDTPTTAQTSANDLVFGTMPTLGILPPAADVLAPGWLLENITPANARDAMLHEAGLAPSTRYQLPAQASWLNPPAPTLLVEAVDLLASAPIANGDGVMSATWHAAGPDAVLVGGDGDDLVIGSQGRDVMVGGFSCDAGPAVGELGIDVGGTGANVAG
jgi:hypothetical protein